MKIDELKELAKKEKLSEWQLGRLLEGIAQLIQAMPLSVIRCIDETTELGLEQVEISVKQTTEKLVACERFFDAQAVAIVRAADEGWKQIKDARTTFDQRVKNLDKLEVPSVYGLKELLDIADRCSHYDEKQWQRVLDLARALK